MAVKVKKVQRKNPLNRNSAKWYLIQEKTGTVDLKEIAREINDRSSLSLGDVQSTLSNLVEMIPLFLKLGQSIKLDGFGSFHLSVKSDGIEEADSLTAHHIKRAKLIFRASPELKRSLEEISFEVA